MTIKHFFRLLIASTHRAPRHESNSLETVLQGLMPGARRALLLAQQEAQFMGHRYIGTEHILLGLLALDEGCAAHPLRQSGLELEHARRQISSNVGPDPHAAPTRWLSGRSVSVLERAWEVALKAGCSSVSTGYLLYALLEEEGPMIHLLEEQGISREKLMSQVSLNLSCAEEGG